MSTTEKAPRVKRELNGLLLLDKPGGMSSNHALQRVKWLLRAKKAGHTGTLDPLATGLLPICLGEATKFSRFQLEADKRYQVTARFGEVTETGDAEGAPVTTGVDLPANLTVIRDRLTQFVGEIDQLPPVYSAIKKNGRRLCDYAREGIAVVPEPRRIVVTRFELLDYAAPEATFTVSCSKGTYIRSLIVDLGEALGCGAHVVQLRRLGSGNLDLEQAVSLSELESIAANGGPEVPQLLPTEMLLEGVERISISTEQVQRLRVGQAVAVDGESGSQSVALFSCARFIGVGELNVNGLLKPTRLLKH